jgi:hypothetical protein
MTNPLGQSESAKIIVNGQKMLVVIKKKITTLYKNGKKKLYFRALRFLNGTCVAMRSYA